MFMRGKKFTTQIVGVLIIYKSVTCQKGYPQPISFVLLPKRGVNHYSSAAVSWVSTIDQITFSGVLSLGLSYFSFFF